MNDFEAQGGKPSLCFGKEGCDRGYGILTLDHKTECDVLQELQRVAVWPVGSGLCLRGGTGGPRRAHRAPGSRLGTRQEPQATAVTAVPSTGTGLGEAFMTTGENGDYEATGENLHILAHPWLQHERSGLRRVATRLGRGHFPADLRELETGVCTSARGQYESSDRDDAVRESWMQARLLEGTDAKAKGPEQVPADPLQRQVEN